MDLFGSVTQMKNVGEQRAKLLEKIGIQTISDLLEYFPKDYVDRRVVKKISEAQAMEVNTIQAAVASTPQNMQQSEIMVTKFSIIDDTGTLDVVWFNQPYIRNVFHVGDGYLFVGKVVIRNNRRVLMSPEYEKLTAEELLSGGRIVPIYSATYKLSQKMIRSLIKNALVYAKETIDFVPNYVLDMHNLCNRSFALENIHFPQTSEYFFAAKKRLAFEEFFTLQLALYQIKGAAAQKSEGIVLFADVAELLKILPYELTNAQKNTLSDILADIESGKQMNRLIQGDVGSGKTAVAIVTSYVAIKCGYQAVMMAPTEVLATQHHKEFSKYFDLLGFETVLLVGSSTQKEKRRIYDDISSGKAQMIIGTHAVIQSKVIFRNAGLVITDEQHRFGVRQRAILSEKGKRPHVLVMTATPIPRTLALILYGDLDISTINELPPGRQKIDTFCVPGSYRKRIYKFISDELQKGRQAYIICASIEASENLEIKSVIEYAESLATEFSDFNVAYLHGKQKPNEKAEIMSHFAKNKIQILVSTTVIEVGINVPNATIMLVENAERFGLSQLHQLRGRVGRGTEKSYCILISDSQNDISKQRLDVMKKTNDGFEISEMDLQLRGPGEFFGTRQHGLPQLKIANLYKDTDILKISQEAAKKIFESDPQLESQENFYLKQKIDSFFGVDSKTVSL